VRVVLHSTDGNGLEFVCARDARHIGPEAGFEFGRNQDPPFFGGKHAMNKKAEVGVGHGGERF